MRSWIALAAPVVLVVSLPTAVCAQDDVPPVIEKFKAKDPGMEKIFADAVGYAVFPTVGKGGTASPSSRWPKAA